MTSINMHRIGDVGHRALVSSCRYCSYAESTAYRESVGHLLLPVHRFEEPQVADYPSWGQAEDRGVVIQGNLHHGVFRLPTERYTKRNMLPW